MQHSSHHGAGQVHVHGAVEPHDLPCDFGRLLRAAAAGVLADALARWPLPTEQLARLAYAPRPGEPYGRRVLHATAQGEVLLVRWRKDTRCAPHDHGSATAHVCLLTGQFVEHRFSFDGSRLFRDSLQAAAAPHVLTVPPHTIHAMQASEAALGLHFYVPRVDGMHLYDCEARRTLRVRDDCGAWLPSAPEHVREATDWP